MYSLANCALEVAGNYLNILRDKLNLNIKFKNYPKQRHVPTKLDETEEVCVSSFMIALQF